MIHEEDKYLQHKMDTADLKEIFPGFDKEGEWLQLAAKMKPKQTIAYGWMKVAAILLVIAACGGFWWYTKDGSKHEIPKNEIADLPAVKSLYPAPADTTADRIDVTQLPMPNNKLQKGLIARNRPTANNIYSTALAAGTYGNTTEAICNATECAIEVCIYQTVNCKGKKPAPIADCRTLEPDQAGQLKYKEPESMGYGCKVSVDEIRIKKVSSGETIILNSKTGAAEEMLQCFTGAKKCDMTAGFFNTDCNNTITPSLLTVDNHHGDVILQ